MNVSVFIVLIMQDRRQQGGVRSRSSKVARKSRAAAMYEL
jgi:hypothetical protein